MKKISRQGKEKGNQEANESKRDSLPRKEDQVNGKAHKGWTGHAGPSFAIVLFKQTRHLKLQFKFYNLLEFLN